METNQTLVVESDLQKKIVDLLNRMGSMTRGEMVSQLQVARTTIYDSLSKLMNRNIVSKCNVSNNKRGRPKTVFRLMNGIVSA